MNVSEMMSLLALRMEDAEKKDFTDAFKLRALNNAQVKLAQMLRDEYLTELQTIKTSLTVTAGVTAVLTAANMGYTPLRGGEGIKKVKDSSSGTYFTEITIDDIKKNENTYLAGTTQNPLFYVFANKIYVLPTSGISTIDVSFLKVPTTLLYEFTMAQTGGTFDTTNFRAATGQGLSSSNDAYNGTTNPERAVIYCTTKNAYFIVTDYVGATCDFIVSPAASGAFAITDKFYFVTNPFDQTNLSGMTCDLNASLHELVVTFAEAECWTMDAKLERREAALTMAYNEIKVLNDRYVKATGIGTDRKGR